MTAEQSTIHDWLHLIQAEYLEMPGLNLTKCQVQRLWKLEPHMCDVLLDALVESEFLKKTQREAYVLAGGVVDKDDPPRERKAQCSHSDTR